MSKRINVARQLHGVNCWLGDDGERHIPGWDALTDQQRADWCAFADAAIIETVGRFIARWLWGIKP